MSLQPVNSNNNLIAKCSPSPIQSAISKMKYSQLVEAGNVSTKFNTAHRMDVAMAVVLTLLFPLYAIGRIIYCKIKEVPITFYWLFMRKVVAETRNTQEVPHNGSTPGRIPKNPQSAGATAGQTQHKTPPANVLSDMQLKHLRLGPIDASDPVPQEHPVGPISTDLTMSSESEPTPNPPVLENSQSAVATAEQIQHETSPAIVVSDIPSKFKLIPNPPVLENPQLADATEEQIQQETSPDNVVSDISSEFEPIPDPLVLENPQPADATEEQTQQKTSPANVPSDIPSESEPTPNLSVPEHSQPAIATEEQIQQETSPDDVLSDIPGKPEPTSNPPVPENPPSSKEPEKVIDTADIPVANDPSSENIPPSETPDAAQLAQLSPSDALRMGKGQIDRRSPVGICNCGNTCYANSVMQMLFINKPFTKAVMALSKILEKGNVFNVLHDMAKVFNHLESGTGSCSGDLMENFLGELAKIPGDDGDKELVKYHAQQDASDFFAYTLRKIKYLCKKYISRQDIISICAENIFSLGTEEIEAIRQMGFCGPDPIFSRLQVHTEEQLFDVCDNQPGKLIRKLSAEDVNFQISIDLEYGNLSDGLRHLDLMDGDNQCENNSGEKIDAYKLRTITQPPNVLYCKLNRVTFEDDAPIKNNAGFEFPMQIDIGPNTPNPDTPLPYDLTGLIVHSGGANSGHYISYAKSDGQWFEFNDGCVQPVDQEKISSFCEEKHGNEFTSVMLVYSAQSALA
jgi:hypothetical protein